MSSVQELRFRFIKPEVWLPFAKKLCTVYTIIKLEIFVDVKTKICIGLCFLENWIA